MSLDAKTRIAILESCLEAKALRVQLTKERFLHALDEYERAKEEHEADVRTLDALKLEVKYGS